MDKTIGIIGSGPGGYVAAIRAAQLGAKVYLIENRELGGTCLNRGCIPTKTLFKNAKIMNNFKRAEEFAIEVDGYRINGKKLQERKDKVVNALVSGVEKLISSYENIEFIAGKASLKDKNTLDIELLSGDKREVSVDNIIIATGSKPQLSETKGADLEGVITSDELLELEEIPENLVVIGGGVIGLEFASIYQELGSNVNLFASRILKDIDTEISRRLPMYLKKQGMKVYKDIRAKEIIKDRDKLRVIGKYKNKDKEVEAVGDKVLMAVGRSAVVEGLNLEAVGIDHNHKGIHTDKELETSIEGIYAIGDVNSNGIQLAHVASSQGIYVVEKIMGLEPDINLEIWPSCVFTLPEVAWAGLTANELKEKDIDHMESKFLFSASGKALSMGETDGFIKVFSSKEDKKLLGVTIVGAHANDLIHEGAFAIANDLDIDYIKRTIHAHPTLSESFAEAVSGLEDKSIHMVPKKKKR